MYKIEITASRSPFTKMVVDGQDISDLVLDYSISQKAGEIPIVTLHLNGSDMTLAEHCAFRFPRAVQLFLGKLQKDSTASDDTETAEKQVIAANGLRDSH